jgi:hypothetical protein
VRLFRSRDLSSPRGCHIPFNITLLVYSARITLNEVEVISLNPLLISCVDMSKKRSRDLSIFSYIIIIIIFCWIKFFFFLIKKNEME